jgi:hypothetical protein
MGGIIWLASYPKSGNTWLRAFYHNFMRNPDRSYDINRMADITVGDSQAQWYREIDPRPASQYSIVEVQQMRPAVHRRLAALGPDSILVKTHNALLEDDGHPLVTQEVTAGAIYLVRNPLDVAVSYSHHLGWTLDQMITFLNTPGASSANTDANVYELHGSWSQNVESWTQNPHPRLHVMRYEDMLEKPLSTFGGLVRFLGIEAPRARIEKAIKLSSFRVLQEQERRHGFRERPAHADAFFREGKAGQWRKALSREQAAAIVAAHRPQMERFGYVPEGF